MHFSSNVSIPRFDPNFCDYVYCEHITNCDYLSETSNCSCDIGYSLNEDGQSCDPLCWDGEIYSPIQSK